LAENLYYDFNFTGVDGVTAMGLFDFNYNAANPGNTTLVGISGSVSGFGNPLDNGSIEPLMAPIPGNSEIIPFVLSTGTNEELFVGQAPTAQLVTGNGEDSIGLLSTTPAPAPAPALDAGPLAYLALGFAGLFINRKRLWRAARMAVGNA